MEPEVRASEAVGAFDRVAVSSALDVDVVQGAHSEILLTGDPRDLDEVSVETRGPTLHLGMRKSGRRHRQHRVHVQVTTPSVKALAVTGASHVEIQGFERQEFLAIVAGGASTVVGQVDGTELTLAISGASTLALEGAAASCGLNATGASDAKLEDLACRDWSVTLSGASDANIHATRSLGPVRLTGASDLNYRGKPKLGSVSITGAADLRAL